MSPRHCQSHSSSPYKTNLETLSIKKDSSNSSYNSGTKGSTCPEPMNRQDLYAILDLLPKKRQGNLAVLGWKDSRAAADPKAGRIREWVSGMCRRSSTVVNLNYITDRAAQGPRFTSKPSFDSKQYNNIVTHCSCSSTPATRVPSLATNESRLRAG